MGNRVWTCPSFDTATNTCTGTAGWQEVPQFLPDLSVEQGLVIGGLIIGSHALAFVFRALVDFIRNR